MTQYRVDLLLKLLLFTLLKNYHVVIIIKNSNNEKKKIIYTSIRTQFVLIHRPLVLLLISFENKEQ